MSYLTHLECPQCGKTYDASKIINICQCGSPLLAKYDIGAAKKDGKLFDDRYQSLWRYRKMLPVIDESNIVTLGEGNTPILEMPKEAAYIGLERLMVKDEGQNPSSSFKTRGASVAVSKIKELGITDVVMDSGGNGAGAWAAYCKRGGIRAHIYMTSGAVEANQKECGFIGGDINMCSGHTSILGKMVSKCMEENPGWFEVRTMKEPYRVEGKKTLGYEIAEQTSFQMPDVILFPTAGGVGVIGIHKAVEELIALGLLDKMPRFVCVQYEGCSPIVKAFQEGKEQCEMWMDKMDVIPGGLSAPKAFADKLLLQILRQTNGNAISVSKEDTMRHWRFISENEGFFTNPEGAATLAAAEALLKDGWLKKDERVLCVMTSNGIKYDDLVEEIPRTIV